MPADAERRDRIARWAVFAIWLAVVVVLARHHVPWRDEVRALSFAEAGDDPIAMIRRIGDGHPALWFLLLRAAYDIVATPLVLPAVALIVAVATMALIVWRAPYRWWQIAIVAASQFMLFDFTVVARNYGISMLLMAAFAAMPDRWRRPGVLPGIALLLLANSNVHSVIFVAGYLLFALIELSRAPSWWRTPDARGWLVSAGLATLGVALCLVSVYPPLNTAVREDLPLPSVAATIVGMIVPGLYFDGLTSDTVTRPLGLAWPFGGVAYQMLALAMSVLLVAASLALARARGAVVAALFALYTLTAMFMLVYPGSYRHEALWLAFVLSLDWMVRDRPGRHHAGRLERCGRGALLALLVLQVPVGLMTAAAVIDPAVPYSRSADLARLIRRDPALARAIIMSEPDYLIESLPYYVTNPLYLPREHRFGRTAQFAGQARLDYALGTMIDDARSLRASTGRPILLLIQRPTGPGAEKIVTLRTRRSFVVTAASLDRLKRCTRLLARYGPAATDESFGVFLLPATPVAACR